MKTLLWSLALFMVFLGVEFGLWLIYHDYQDPVEEELILRILEGQTQYGDWEPPTDPPGTPDDDADDSTDPSPEPNNPTGDESRQEQPGDVDENALPDSPGEVELLDIAPSGRDRENTPTPGGARPRVEIGETIAPISTTDPAAYRLPGIDMSVPAEPERPGLGPTVEIEPVRPIAGDDGDDTSPLQKIEPVKDPEPAPGSIEPVGEIELVSIEELSRRLRQQGMKPVDARVLLELNNCLTRYEIRERYSTRTWDNWPYYRVKVPFEAGMTVIIVLNWSQVPPGIGFAGQNLGYLLESPGRIEASLRAICGILEKENQ